jgi:DNA mismatch endonuclease (patch repair protein)
LQAEGARPPEANADYWRAKIAKNRARDLANVEKARGAGLAVAGGLGVRDQGLAALERRLRAFLA